MGSFGCLQNQGVAAWYMSVRLNKTQENITSTAQCEGDGWTNWRLMDHKAPNNWSVTSYFLRTWSVKKKKATAEETPVISNTDLLASGWHY